MTLPSTRSGVTVTSTAMIGSSSTGPARSAPSFTAIDPAILNAISDESTSWYDPSMSVTESRPSDTRPGRPLRAASSHALLHGGDELSRDGPPTRILLTNSEALSGLARLDLEPDMPVLAASARLADELPSSAWTLA